MEWITEREVLTGVDVVRGYQEPYSITHSFTLPHMGKYRAVNNVLSMSTSLIFNNKIFFILFYKLNSFTARLGFNDIYIRETKRRYTNILYSLALK